MWLRVIASSWRTIFCLSLLFVAVACNRKTFAPEGTVRLFLINAANGDVAEAYAMLVPKDQARLTKLAQRASAQTGNRRQFKPHEMLATNLADPQHPIGTVELVQRSGGVATVKINAAKGKYSETWQLLLVKGKWRVKLPAHAFAEPPEPLAPPTASPASRPVVPADAGKLASP